LADILVDVSPSLRGFKLKVNAWVDKKNEKTGRLEMKE